MTRASLRSDPRLRGRGRHRSPWTPRRLRPRAWYDAELGQPKYVGYVQLNGGSTDNISTPDSALNSFSNDIEVIMRVRPDDWTTGATQTLCGKYLTTGNQRSWRFYVSAAGAIGLTASVNGTAVTTIAVTPTTSFVDATWIWLRLRLDLTNGANSVGTIDIAADTGNNYTIPTSWTTNGTNTGTTIAGIFNGTGAVEIGSFGNGTSERLAGRVGRCIVNAGFDGTTTSDFNADDCYGDGYTHTDGYRWTLGLPKIYDRSGNNHPPAVFGAGSNSPKWLPWDGRPSVYLTGVSGNYVSCPDAAHLGITGDIEFVARIDPVLGVTQRILSKDDLAAQRSYGMDVKASGELGVIVRVAAATVSAQSSAATQGIPQWVKVTRESSSGVTKFYTAPDQPVEPVSWTQLGADVAATSGLIDVSTARLTIGAISASGSFPFSGRVYRAIVRDGIGGTTVADFDASQCGQSGFTDEQGNPWTANRSTSGRKTVVQSPVANSARSVILHGTDGYIDVPVAACPSLDGDHTYGITGRLHATPVNFGGLFQRRVLSGNTEGIYFRSNGTTASLQAVWRNNVPAEVNDGAAGTASVRSVATASRSGSTGTLRVNAASGAGAALSGTYEHASGGRTGTNGFIYQDMEFEALVLLDAATSNTEHVQLVAYYGGGL